MFKREIVNEIKRLITLYNDGIPEDNRMTYNSVHAAYNYLSEIGALEPVSEPTPNL